MKILVESINGWAPWEIRLMVRHASVNVGNFGSL